jgi:hypothetical protein
MGLCFVGDGLPGWPTTATNGYELIACLHEKYCTKNTARNSVDGSWSLWKLESQLRLQHSSSRQTRVSVETPTQFQPTSRKTAVWGCVMLVLLVLDHWV